MEYRYPFKLATATWPPTYYGTYLSVSHYVHVRASLPWKFDTKGSAEYLVVATQAPDDLTPTTKKNEAGIATKIILGTLGLVIGIPLLFLMSFLIPIVLIIGGLYWFFRVFLPGRITGKVECELASLQLKPGQQVTGSLVFTPKKSSQINGIIWKLMAEEVCSSGSGSNRTTHRYQLVNKVEKLMEARQLVAGQRVELPIDVMLPANAPPSLKFTDNELTWSGELRIDIPGWPDFVKSFKLVVAPSNSSVSLGDSTSSREFDDFEDDEDDEEDLTEEARGDTATAVANEAMTGVSDEGDVAQEILAFDEVAEQIQATQDDPDKLMLIVEAVQGLDFNVRADLQGRMYQPPAGVSADGGQWSLARHRSTGLDMCLLWPQGTDSPRGTAFDWEGTITVLGYDTEHDRVIARVK